MLRSERGLTIRQAAALIGVAKETLSDLERGARHPQDLTLAKIARGYGVSVEDLLELQKETASPKVPSLLTPQTWQAWLADHGAGHLATSADEFNEWFIRLPETERERVFDEVKAERDALRPELVNLYRTGKESRKRLVELVDRYTKMRIFELTLLTLGMERISPEDEDDDEELTLSPRVVEVTSDRQEVERQLEALAG